MSIGRWSKETPQFLPDDSNTNPYYAYTIFDSFLYLSYFVENDGVNCFEGLVTIRLWIQAHSRILMRIIFLEGRFIMQIEFIFMTVYMSITCRLFNYVIFNNVFVLIYSAMLGTNFSFVQNIWLKFDIIVHKEKKFL